MCLTHPVFSACACINGLNVAGIKEQHTFEGLLSRNRSLRIFGVAVLSVLTFLIYGIIAAETNAT